MCKECVKILFNDICEKSKLAVEVGIAVEWGAICLVEAINMAHTTGITKERFLEMVAEHWSGGAALHETH